VHRQVRVRVRGAGIGQIPMVGEKGELKGPEQTDGL